MRLVIAEKKELAKAIAEIFPGTGEIHKEYIKKDGIYITWSRGHILEFKEPEDIDPKYKIWKKEDLPIYFENWEKKPKVIKPGFNETPEEKNKRERSQEGIKNQLATIERLLKSYEVKEIIHAGDPDPEGQLLIDEILEYFSNTKPVKRVLINDNSPEKVKEAFNNLRDNKEFKSLSESAYARSFADMIFGINLTRFFTVINPQIKGVLTLGRVVSPTLGLIIQRYLDIKEHKKTLYFELFSNGSVNKKSNKTEREEVAKIKNAYDHEFCNEEKRKELMSNLINEFERLNETSVIKFKFIPGKEILEDGKILNKSILEEIQKEVKGFHFLKVEKEIKKENAPLPFNLLELQKYCNKKWGYSGEKVMKITQNLRDTYKAITYNRSDCRYLSNVHYQEAPAVIERVLKNFNIEVQNIDFNRKSKCFNDSLVTAHHAIIPTNINVDINKLNIEEKNVYSIISNYYISQFLPACVKEQTVGNINILDTLDLKATSVKVLDYGYKIFLNEKTEEKDETTPLSSLYSGEYEIQLTDSGIESKETKPPKMYDEGSLLDDMSRISKYVEDKELQKVLRDRDKDIKGENGGIGTSATRSGIISKIFNLKFSKTEDKVIIPTELGLKYYEYLPDELKKADITAKWWIIQEEIIKGEANAKKLISSVFNEISEVIRKGYKPMGYTLSETSDNEKLCPKCGNKIIKNSKSFYCSGYHSIKCDFSIWIENKVTNSTLTETQVKNLIQGKSITVKGEKYKLNDLKKISKDIKEKDKMICPKCKEKEVVNSLKAWNCSCGFTLFKESKLYGEISIDNFKKLIKGEEVILYNITSAKGSKYSGKFELNLSSGKYASLKLVEFLKK